MIRWQMVELTDTGYGRRVYTDTLAAAWDVAIAMGGEWRLRRQYWTGKRWTIDGGQRAERYIGEGHG